MQDSYPVAPDLGREHDGLVIGEAVMPTTPTMLPTMRYDRDRKVVLIGPRDEAQPYLVTREAIEHRIGRGGLSPDELIEVCEEQEAYFALIAVRKLLVGEIDPDGRAVVLAYDVKPIACL